MRELKDILLLLCFLIFFVPPAVFIRTPEVHLHVVLPVGIAGFDRILFELLLHQSLIFLQLCLFYAI